MLAIHKQSCMLSPAKMQTPMRATGFKGLGLQQFQTGVCLLAIICSTGPRSTAAAANLYCKCIGHIATREQSEVRTEAGQQALCCMASMLLLCLKLGHSCSVYITAVSSSMEQLHVKCAMQSEPIRKQQDCH